MFRPMATAFTTNHDEIREWAEERGGVPARAEGGAGQPDTLCIDFPGASARSLERISWEEWFETFEDEELVFVYEAETAGAATSRWSQLATRDDVERDHETTVPPVDDPRLTSGT
jgi:hypothetical protein